MRGEKHTQKRENIRIKKKNVWFCEVDVMGIMNFGGIMIKNGKEKSNEM